MREVDKKVLGAVQAAVLAERNRCLALLDGLVKDLRADLDKKILIEGQRHLIQTKLKIAEAIVRKVSGKIRFGLLPMGADDAMDLEGK